MERLTYLAEAAKYDVCLASCNGNSKGGSGRTVSREDPVRWIFPASVPGKGQVSMLKVLQSNHCKNHCRYCAFSLDNDRLRRVKLLPEELASLFMGMVERDRVHGIFLSTGIAHNPDDSMEQMLRTAEILRYRYRFQGYIHLKALPGCSQDRLDEALNLADRISLNLESATVKGLARMAPDKELKSDLLKRMFWAANRLKQGKTRCFSQTTQFVVGPSEEKDWDILKTVDWVYRDLHVFRSYFSAYQQPHSWAPPAEPGALIREHRLYQSDFLLRSYGFRMTDLVFDSGGNLPLHVDPKSAYALTHREKYPVEINQADLLSLLKVPGIGPGGAEKILEQRKIAPLKEMKDLKRLGILCQRAAPWILLQGKRPQGQGLSGIRQRWLFPEMQPDHWQTGIKPHGMDKVLPYDYPAQRGKRVNYPMGNARAVPCR